MLFILASIISLTYHFPAFIACKSRPDTTFATWILLHCSFEKKKLKIEASYLCGIRVAQQRHKCQTM
jgi:hypothetical protein